jgi:hypothetical protein
MTIIENLKTNGALCKGVDPMRPRVAAALLDRCREVRALSLLFCRTRGPPGAR